MIETYPHKYLKTWRIRIITSKNQGDFLFTKKKKNKNRKKQKDFTPLQTHKITLTYHSFNSDISNGGVNLDQHKPIPGQGFTCKQIPFEKSDIKKEFITVTESKHG